MARRTTQGKTNSRIKFKIYSTMLLYSKEGQIGKLIDKLKDVKYFNKLDLIWEYNNV